jgi:hypothetical protein
MTVDFTPLVQPLIVAAGVVISTLLSYGVVMLRAHFKSVAAQLAIDIVSKVAQIGAGVAYNHMVLASKGANNVGVSNAAIAEGAKIAMQVLAEYQQGNNISDDVIRKQVAGELGKLLAIDPNTATGQVNA